MGADGVFVGQKIQAKCASKYEADPATALRKKPASGRGTIPSTGL